MWQDNKQLEKSGLVAIEELNQTKSMVKDVAANSIQFPYNPYKLIRYNSCYCCSYLSYERSDNVVRVIRPLPHSHKNIRRPAPYEGCYYGYSHLDRTCEGSLFVGHVTSPQSHCASLSGHVSLVPLLDSNLVTPKSTYKGICQHKFCIHRNSM